MNKRTIFDSLIILILISSILNKYTTGIDNNSLDHGKLYISNKFKFLTSYRQKIVQITVN